MTTTYPAARPVAELDMPADSARLHRKTIARAVNDAMRGHTNTTIFVTLDAGSATTVVIDPRISTQTCASLCPTSANAAAQLPTLWAQCSNGTLTLHHTNSGLTDRTYNMGIFG